MSKISQQGRHELVIAVGERYRLTTNKVERSLILDEFVRITGYHRKHAIRLLRNRVAVKTCLVRTRPCIYDEAVRSVLIVLWEAADRICGKRLKPLLPLLISSLEKHGHIDLDSLVRTRVLQASASTIDRLLAPARAKNTNKRKPQRKAVRGQIPIRTSSDWGDPVPGFMETDLVAHGGGSAAGRFNHTLTLTDISSGWTECVPLAVRDSSLVVHGLDHLRTSMPFPLLGIDSDNGSEFINDTVLAFCKQHSITFTRARPRRKNDQAWVEQKNGSVVRRLVGYGRLEGIAAAESLGRLYASSRLFVNCFQPSFKLKSKERVGAHVRKKYYQPETPCSRLLASPHIEESMKERLAATLAALDPLRLLDEIRTMQEHIARLCSGEEAHRPADRDADLERFLASLETAWLDGEVRPTHKQKPAAHRWWRTREDPFASEWPRVLIWLEEAPDSTAKELFERLCAENPGRHRSSQLRTLQRRVKVWRQDAARRLVFGQEKTSESQTSP